MLFNSFGRYRHFHDSLIQGDTDSIWTDGVGVFRDCEIRTVNAGHLCQMRSEPLHGGIVFLSNPDLPVTISGALGPVVI